MSMRRKRLVNLIMAAAFVAAISVPFVTMWFSDGKNSEERRLATFPSMEFSTHGLESFPKDLDAYVNDRFGFRNVFLSLHSYLMYKVFHLSGTQQVIAGHGDWLFISDVGSRPDIERTARFSGTELRDWKLALEQRYTWLKDQGIGYRFMVGPDKNTIYPEYLPRQVQGKGPSRLQELEGYLGETPYFINPSQSLIAHKSDGNPDLFFHTDTHWTPYGAYIGYRDLMQSIGSPHPYAYENTTFMTVAPSAQSDIGSTDMSRMIRIPVVETTYQPKKLLSPECTIHRQAQWPLGFSMPNYPTSLFATTCPGKSGTVLVFRDSYFNSVIPYFSQNYGRVVYAWTIPNSDILAKMVAQEKPELVIEERVERSMYAVPKPDLYETIDRIHHDRKFTTTERDTHRRSNEFLGADVRVVSNGGSIKFLAGGRMLASASGTQGAGGNIDAVTTTATGITYSGWAALRDGGLAAEFIVATSGNRVINVAPSQQFERRDVATHYDSDLLLRSGFSFEIPNDFTHPQVRLYAVNGNKAAPIGMPIN
ncbi:hypothetical protein WS83_06980 [Burkholderia sp. MSMB2042]|uniref:AlgX/AlgJ SGNH hydrolase-like domain-containing protein n=2 Tax=Burkholderiaceae TaxID=119060 RepID=A0ABR5TA10_9BURK|nr:hypothetical protein WS78_01295 [Burkholderia savannae]KVG40937.1 hypothetical protein WS77_17820 [Burkholderia sp. MSMB0265]KVG85409.1 hypothetical protein WS81_04200 [Burkholderia sp. MSMB2040]KVG94637.1 hypothetical protein WS83_06980 [Burkholderia sp. MSMB2042]KVG95068.1 hypothetical protein WS82_00375 [Burkholderia sp. MSMB2041]KVK72602.1 hypothetical protein WS91_21915 [Burkholderia sp. MSMB1498]